MRRTDSKSLANPIDQIHACKPSLRGRHTQMADLILESPYLPCFSDVRGLAEKLGVSPSTIVRFARCLGYRGYPDFQVSFQNYVQSRWSFEERLEETIRASKSRTASYAQPFEQDIALLREGMSQTSPKAILNGVSEIKRAKNICVLGVRSSFAAAYYLAFRLLRQGFPCRLVGYPGSSFFTELADLRRGYLLIMFTGLPDLLEVVGACRLARRRGARTLAVVSSISSKLAREADIVLFAPRGKESAIQSMTATIALCNCLLWTLARKTHKRGFERMRDVSLLERVFSEGSDQYEMLPPLLRGGDGRAPLRLPGLT